ncbi:MULTISPECIES: Ig-like domain-containing protein [unclassified Coleofasciculus]|uniref:Ig-like domain-containing protein n=1 Tax=unclassified Coleofasciculus TaxID=2692782 RepID=UPI001880B3BE|nr:MULTISPECIES: Ig-like domain-containing protein [unclassified Coleofasciculus]MBE9126553.1 TonB-dependent receptor [Coleofasciculus sp. LEGE 07081]MBE9149987.1 TonB-dependent receptor [Coleofasciculus sp. LEGE 07092]
MKPALNFRHVYSVWLVGAIAGTMVTVMHPTTAKAEPVNPVPDTVSTTESIYTPRFEKPQRPPASGESATPEVGNPSQDALKTGIENRETQLPFPVRRGVGGEVNPNSLIDTSNTSENTSPAEPETIKILTPTANTVLDIPSTTVILQYRPGAQVELRVNGNLVDRAAIGQTETDNQNQVVTETWYGVVFEAGENTLTAQATLNGVTEPPVSVKVEVRDAPTKLTVETVEAQIPADGRSTAMVQGQLLDKNGNRSNYNAVITLNPSAGKFIGADYNPDQPGFQVQAQNGQYSATLQSDLNAQTVRIQAVTTGLEAFTQLQFNTALRSNLITGVVDFRLGARGTNYYGSLRDFLPLDEDNSTQLDVTGAAFATGHIGEWQYTGAFNSDRPLNEDCNCNNRLFRSDQASERPYPVYGDSSTVDVLAPSTDNLYLRLERSAHIPDADPDYVMWGDYNTHEFATTSQQFTSFTRQLHGFKANYNLGNLQITGFYANNVEGFQRDTIAPDGTSGYYFLSRRLLIPGSEDVFIELEELNRPGTVLQRERLTRGPDYEVDYDRGTLLFRRPVLRTDIADDGTVLVRRIVSTYQFESQDDDTSIYGGRVQYHISRQVNRESWIGATYLGEDQGTRDFELYGADALISFGKDNRLIAEYAHSSNTSELLGKISGSAYRIEADVKIAEGIQGYAYYRSADTGFSNNATVSFVPGQTRYGAELQAKVSPTTTARVQYDHEDNEGIAPRPLDVLEEFLNPLTEPIPGSAVDNSLTTVSVGIQQRIGTANLAVDWIYRDRTDRLAPNDLSGTSNQLRSRFTLPITDTLTFRAINELTLSSQVDAVYPDRTGLGLDWAVYPGIKVSLEQQWFTRGQYSGQSITSLNVTGDYKLGANTTLTGRYSILGGIDGLTSQGAIGLNHRWTIASGLHMDLAYEHVFGDLLGRTGAGSRFEQPYAFGQSASALGLSGGDSYSVGLEYTDNPNFKASARFQHRTSSQGSNTVIFASALGKLSPALTALLSYNQASSANQKLQGLGTTANLRLGLAYRDPNDDRFNALLRYEYRKNPSIIPETILFGNGTGSEELLFSAEAIYAPNWRWEFYGKYAFRSSTSYLADDLVGTSSVSLTQLRATYRLGYNFDLVGEARWITQPSANYNELGFLLEAGYWLTPSLRLSAGYVFGEVNDRDFSGTRSAGGPYLGLTVKLSDLFDGFGQPQPRIAPSQQQDSQVEPVATEVPAEMH